MVYYFTWKNLSSKLKVKLTPVFFQQTIKIDLKKELRMPALGTNTHLHRALYPFSHVMWVYMDCSSKGAQSCSTASGLVYRVLA